jgi:hypothetical protein
MQDGGALHRLMDPLKYMDFSQRFSDAQDLSPTLVAISQGLHGTQASACLVPKIAPSSRTQARHRGTGRVSACDPSRPKSCASPVQPHLSTASVPGPNTLARTRPRPAPVAAPPSPCTCSTAAGSIAIGSSAHQIHRHNAAIAPPSCRPSTPHIHHNVCIRWGQCTRTIYHSLRPSRSTTVPSSTRRRLHRRAKMLTCKTGPPMVRPRIRSLLRRLPPAVSVGGRPSQGRGKRLV